MKDGIRRWKCIPVSRRCRAVVLLALFTIVWGMAVFPQLHKFLHHDADRQEHSCAVTLLLSGGNEAPSCITEPVFIPIQFFTSVNFQCAQVAPFFISCFVPDHSPPSFS